MTNTAKLEERILSSGLKKAFIAKAIGISRFTFKSKCENRSQFTAKEISALCAILQINSLEEKEEIFFDECVI